MDHPDPVDPGHPAAVNRSGVDALTPLCESVARLLGAESAQLSLLTDVQIVATAVGPAAATIGNRTPIPDSLCKVAADDRRTLVVPDARADARVSHMAPVVDGVIAAYIGAPLFGSDGVVLGALCAFDVSPRTWSESDVVLIGQLASAAARELELAAERYRHHAVRTRLDLAIEAGAIATFDWNLLTGHLEWDERMIAMYGYDEGDVRFDHSIDSVYARVHPDDADYITTLMNDAIAAVGPMHVLYRIVLPDGSQRTLEARGRALPDSNDPDGPAVRLVGLSWDITEQQQLEARADRVLELMSVGYVVLDADWRVTYLNAEAEHLLGRARAQLIGDVLWDHYPDMRESDIGGALRRVLATGVTETVESYYPAPVAAWFEVRAIREGHGVAFYFLDITARHAAQELLALSSEVSDTLLKAIDVDSAIVSLTRMVVPLLGDWAIGSLVSPEGTSDVAGWHRDPALRSVTEAYRTELARTGDSGLPRLAVESETPVVVAAGLTEQGVAQMRPGPAREAYLTLAPESAVAVPLLAGGKVAGVLTIARGADRPPIADHELATLVSICGRAGVAIDNIGLYAAKLAAAEHDRTIAQALQQSMLTTLPTTPDIELVARYRTAADHDQIGGDWYDAVVADDGTTTVMIGDVVGHDIKAAALMGQLRSMLRMTAWDRDEPPSAILGRLDSAMAQMHLRTMATVITARVRPASTGTPATVQWSNAGHPPPILARVDAPPEVLTGSAIDLLLGVDPDTTRRDHTCVLPPGSMLLLYTDGLIETRDDDLDAGAARLVAALTRHHGLPVGELLDAVLTDMVGSRPPDDVALLAARLTGAPPTVRPLAGEALEVRLPPTADAAALARRYVGEQTAALARAAVSDAQLLASELVSNALRYGAPGISLSVQTDESGIRVAVRDHGLALPVLADGPPDPTKPSGRGLLIVAALASEWGVTPAEDGSGKTVWFRITS